MTTNTYPVVEESLTTSGCTNLHVHTHPQPIDDTLRYKVSVSKAIAHDTVRVSANVTVLTHPQQTTDIVLAQEIEPTLRDFIAAEWVISYLERKPDAAGYERLTMQASARVEISENFNLIERARRASRDGISLSEPETHRSISVDRVQSVVKELWFRVVAVVNLQKDEFSKASGRTWRIGDIELGQIERTGDNRYTKGAARTENDQFFAEVDEPAAKQGGERISLSANVVLRSTAI